MRFDKPRARARARARRYYSFSISGCQYKKLTGVAQALVDAAMSLPPELGKIRPHSFKSLVIPEGGSTS